MSEEGQRHKASQAKTPGGLTADYLLRARLDNAQLMNAIRLIFGLGFAVLYAVGIAVYDIPSLKHTAGLLAAYVVFAGLLWSLSRRSRAVLNASRFAVPIIDLPMAIWIQANNIERALSVDAMALFTLSVFLFLTAMSAFCMRSRYVYGTAAVAAVGLVCLYTTKTELNQIYFLSGPLTLFLAAWMLSYLPTRQSRLIIEAAERQARRDRLALYFSPGVAEIIESHDEPGEGESCELTVLFCDIRGFTRLSETLDAREVVRFLNAFHGEMVEAIFRFGGTLDKYLGDGLLAYFNAPVRQADHAERSVHCALAMLERLESLNKGRAVAGETPIRVGIGIHSGQAVVGHIGASHRREFTAIGDTVNVASRLQDLTKNYENTNILVSAAVVEQVAASGALAFEAIDRLEVRGRQRPVEVFRPVIPAPPAVIE